MVSGASCIIAIDFVLLMILLRDASGASNRKWKDDYLYASL